MTAHQLFAQKAFASALSTVVGVNIKPETVMAESVGDDKIDCLVLYSADGSSHTVTGSFHGDEEGGEVRFAVTDLYGNTMNHSYWFMADEADVPLQLEVAA